MFHRKPGGQSWTAPVLPTIVGSFRETMPAPPTLPAGLVPDVLLGQIIDRLEETEVDAAVNLLLYESGVLLERVLVPVLQNQIPLRIYQAGIQHLVRNRLQPFQRIRRVGEHDIELLPADGNEIEHIVMDGSQILQAQLPGLLLDERGVLHIHLH